MHNLPIIKREFCNSLDSFYVHSHVHEVVFASIKYLFTYQTNYEKGEREREREREREDRDCVHNLNFHTLLNV